MNHVLKRVLLGADTSSQDRDIDPVPVECDPPVMPSDEETVGPRTEHSSDTVRDMAEDPPQPLDGQ